MLLEPGPLALFTDDELPIATPSASVVDLIAGEVSTLDAGATALGAQQAAISGGDASADAGTVANAIGAAASEVDRQAGALDGSIGTVAANVDGLHGDLSGLSNDVTGDLATAQVPPPPPLPPGYEPGSGPSQNPRFGDNGPGQGNASGSGGGSAPPPASSGGGSSAGDLWPASAPVARDGSGGSDGSLVALYRGYLDNDVPRALGRAPSDTERSLVDAYFGKYGYLDNSAYNWILSTFILSGRV